MTDEARAGEPRTEAGRRLYTLIGALPHILAIEAEAAAAPALDVERLARALMDSTYGLRPHPPEAMNMAKAVARAYDRTMRADRYIARRLAEKTP